MLCECFIGEAPISSKTCQRSRLTCVSFFFPHEQKLNSLAASNVPFCLAQSDALARDFVVVVLHASHVDVDHVRTDLVVSWRGFFFGPQASPPEKPSVAASSPPAPAETVSPPSGSVFWSVQGSYGLSVFVFSHTREGFVPADLLASCLGGILHLLIIFFSISSRQ